MEAKFTGLNKYNNPLIPIYKE